MYANLQDAMSMGKWLEKLLSKANKRLFKPQESYKCNFEAKLRKRKETLVVGDNV